MEGELGDFGYSITRFELGSLRERNRKKALIQYGVQQGTLEENIHLLLDGSLDAHYRLELRDEMRDLNMETIIARVVDQDFLLHSKLLVLSKSPRDQSKSRPHQSSIHSAKDEYQPRWPDSLHRKQSTFQKISCLSCIPKDGISSEDMVKL
jgi:hypothetical protein